MVRCLPAPVPNELTDLYTNYHRGDTAAMANAVAEYTQVLRSATLAIGFFPGTQSENFYLWCVCVAGG